MPKRLSTSREILSIFDAPPEPIKPTPLSPAQQEKRDQAKRKGIKPQYPKHPGFLRDRQSPSFQEPEQAVKMFDQGDIPAPLDPQNKEQILTKIDEFRSRVMKINLRLDALAGAYKELGGSELSGSESVQKMMAERRQLLSERDKIRRSVLPGLYQYLYQLDPSYVDVSRSGLIPKSEQIEPQDAFLSPAEKGGLSDKEIAQAEKERRKDIQQTGEQRAIQVEQVFKNYFDRQDWGHDPLSRVDDLRTELKALSVVNKNAAKSIRELVLHDAKSAQSKIEQLQSSGAKLSAVQEDLAQYQQEIERLKSLPEQYNSQLQQLQQQLESMDPNGIYRKRLELPNPAPNKETYEILSGIRELMGQIKSLESKIQSLDVDKQIQYLQKMVDSMQADPAGWDSRQEEMNKPRVVEPKPKTGPSAQEIERENERIRGIQGELRLQQRPKWEMTPDGRYELKPSREQMQKDFDNAFGVLRSAEDVLQNINDARLKTQQENPGDKQRFRTLSQEDLFSLIEKRQLRDKLALEYQQNPSDELSNRLAEASKNYDYFYRLNRIADDQRKALEAWYDSQEPDIQNISIPSLRSFIKKTPSIREKINAPFVQTLSHFSEQEETLWWEKNSAKGSYYQNALNRVNSQIAADAISVVRFFTENPKMWNESYAQQAMTTDYAVGAMMELVKQMSSSAKSSPQEFLPGIGDHPEEMSAEKAFKEDAEPAEEAPSEEERAAEDVAKEDVDPVDAVSQPGTYRQQVNDALKAVMQSDEEDVDILTSLGEAAVEPKPKIKGKKKQFPAGEPQLPGSLDDYRRYGPDANPPSFKTIKNQIMTIAADNPDLIIEETGKPISEYVSTDEAGRPFLNQSGRALAEQMHLQEIEDYITYLMYTPMSDQDPVAENIQKGLLYEAYRLDPRLIARGGDRVTQSVVDQMINHVFLNLSQANREREVYSLFNQWDRLSQTADDKGEMMRDAIGRWLRGQITNTRQRLNRELWGRNAWTPEYKKWFDDFNTFKTNVKEGLGIVKGKTKKDIPTEVWQQYFQEIGKYQREFPEPQEKYNKGFSDLAGVLQDMTQEEGSALTDYLEGYAPAKSRPEMAGEDVAEEVPSESVDIDERLQFLDQFAQDNPKFEKLIRFVYEHPDLFSSVGGLTDYNKQRSEWVKKRKEFLADPKVQQHIEKGQQEWESKNPAPEDPAEMDEWQAKREQIGKSLVKGVRIRWESENPAPKKIPGESSIEVKDWNRLVDTWNEELDPSAGDSAVGRKYLEKLFTDLKKAIADARTPAAPKTDVVTPAQKTKNQQQQMQDVLKNVGITPQSKIDVLRRLAKLAKLRKNQ
jgi:hypothetical protein